MTTALTTVSGTTARPGWPTPRILRSIIGAIGAAALIVTLVSEGAFARARAGVKTLHTDTAPSIVAALEIRALLADIDANVANLLLESDAHNDEVLAKIEDERGHIATRLIEAAENITYGDAEKVPITTLTTSFGRYLEQLGELRYRHGHGDIDGALGAYRVATDLMHTQLLPAAEALDTANKDVMNAVYDEQIHGEGAAESGLKMLVTAIVAGLLAAQIFLFRRTRRVLNLPLFAATFVMFGYGVHVAGSFDQTRVDLRVAKVDAFESIHTLWKARAIAYDANGDESRYLADPLREGDYERSFAAKVLTLSSSPTFPPAMETAARALKEGAKLPMSGLFADELDNITFPGERVAAIEMARDFAAYTTTDKQMRALHRVATEQKHREAIALCLGRSNDQFELFDRATLSAIRINREAFDRSLDAATSRLTADAKATPFIALLLAVAGFLGIRPRLREYA